MKLANLFPSSYKVTSDLSFSKKNLPLQKAYKRKKNQSLKSLNSTQENEEVRKDKKKR